MKFGSIGRALVRYFGRPATSVPPEIPITNSMWGQQAQLTPAALDRVEEAAQRLYGGQPLKLVTGAELLRGYTEPYEPAVRIESGAVDTRPGIKPPDVWTWEAWSKEFESLRLDGWSPCRFAHITNKAEEGERAVFVFGVVRGAFGLWQQTFDIWRPFAAAPDHTNILTVVTHLRTGYGIAVFGTKVDAAQACTLAEQCSSWEQVADSNKIAWGIAMRRTRDAWHDLGIRSAVDFTAFDQSTGAGPLSIMGLSYESASEGKPEKPS